MSFLVDFQIRELCEGLEEDERPMLRPFIPEQIRDAEKLRQPAGRVISFGLSSCGYDIRLHNEFRVFRPRFDRGGIIDPKEMDPELLQDYCGESCLIPPHGYVLARSLEWFHMPPDVVGLCVGKSTYARCGILINTTPLEPGWQGYLVIEIGNVSSLPARIHSGEGIAQVLFARTERPETTYADRGGKYQNQTGVKEAEL